MKRVLLLLAFVSMTAIGCQTHSQLANDDCQSCGPSGHGQYAATCPSNNCGPAASAPGGCRTGAMAGSYGRNSADYVPQVPYNYGQQTQPAGPATGTYAYPYYTVRAPRDFFLDAPSTIGY